MVNELVLFTLMLYVVIRRFIEVYSYISVTKPGVPFCLFVHYLLRFDMWLYKPFRDYSKQKMTTTISILYTVPMFAY